MLATDEIHQDDPNFKLIYGCEAYFVDDMIPAVYGTKTMPITGSFVVFDTETTGLDSNVEALTEIGAVYVENGKINRIRVSVPSSTLANHPAKGGGADRHQRQHGGRCPHTGRGHPPIQGILRR